MLAWRRVALAMSMGAATGAQAPASLCQVPAFRSDGQGGIVEGSMRVSNGGGPCGIRLWADVEARRPYATIAVTRAPAHGSVTVTPDGVAYRPDRGYAGPDIFEMTATGTGRQGAVATGMFRIGVTVVAQP
ncbi:hypothetical protein J5Y09_21065 [Roseomonas sp. PWR1]|uniref:Uncharacterized protein n=1 Tax=Roseomonas nitratireducens TaxID=2820810 RepID=A0ABS4AYR2_9PROT|nr:Ig-like domain-containing protein [Neoroseomonas nitratireducens]MBP0466432.1 hypothetical protein [Neoroseomonas nitratireducens]